MTYYANLFDLTELEGLFLSLTSQWFDKNPVDLDPNRIDEMYVPIRGDDSEQITARAEILSDQGVRVKNRS